MNAETRSLPAMRILAVHAHPDDETSSNGSTIAAYADRGAHITLVTCTLGEEGEIHLPELEGLAAARGDQLGGYRMWELRAACAALGVTEQHFLGGAGRYRDSGMMGDPANDNPQAFWQADLDEAASHLVPIIRTNRPQVLLTYDENGGYGHPDHIQAHRVAMRARDLAADGDYAPESGDVWRVAKVYYGAVPRSVFAKALQWFAENGQPDAFGGLELDDMPWLTDDELVTTAISGEKYVQQTRAALAAHRSQIPPDHPFFSMIDQTEHAFRHDFYQLARGDKGPVDAELGYETDLFAGISLT